MSREILFRGKRIDNGEWVYGYYSPANIPLMGCIGHFINEGGYRAIEVDPETVGQYTGVTANGTKIFEGDIVRYNTFDDFDCHSIVAFGEYEQDGSSGEYKPRSCIGFYVSVNNFTCPDWCDNEPEYFSHFLQQQNICEVATKCEVIGNIHDNPELMEVQE